jgi:hypothetical protein
MNRSRKIWWKSLLVAVACICCAGVIAPVASAGLEFAHTGVRIVNPDGTFSRQAGGHPDFKFRVELPPGPPKAPRDIVLDLPPGMVGNPTPFPTCELAEMFINRCPVESQIGTVKIRTTGNFPTTVWVGLFNLPHGPEIPALFAFKYITSVATITPEVRPTDYGISSGSFEITQAEPFDFAEVTLWGVPAAASHNFERHAPGPAQVNPFIDVPDHAPLVPFFTNPTSCPESATPFTARGDSWEEPGIFDERVMTADEDGTAFLWEGCEKLPFDPALHLSPATHQAHTPTGLAVDLEVPSNEGPNSLAVATLKETAITLPEGMSISPSAAAGQASCSRAQAMLGSNKPPTCPANSRIGTVEIETQLLDERLEGEVVLASQNDNPFGATYALYLMVKGPGFYLKLPGELQVDRQTGQMKTVFSDLPQLPFEHMHLELRDGPTAPLKTPSTCGIYSIRTEMASWAKPDQPVVDEVPMKIDEGCAGRGFSPTLRGGVSNPIAGAHSPLTIAIQRQDGEENVARIDVTLPEGQLASLKGIPECPEADAAAGSCPAASEIGTVSARVGIGTSPLEIPQAGKQPTAFYLAGPYRGAPLSVIAKIPAQAGPFDFGNVMVRTALAVDPATAQVTARSDALPQLIEGVPLQYREVRIELTRAGFAVNPTSCKRQALNSTITSVSGTEAHPSAPYQVGDCASLGFKPKLALSLKGKMNRTGNPALKAVLKAPKGQANIAKTTVILPPAMFIDNAHINNPCTRVQFNANECPKGSILGQATAYTPLLDKPLTGPVYFRSNGGDRKLPDLVADLKGQIHVTLVGFIDAAKSGGVRTRFADVPDAPVSKFVLKLYGGKKGLIENSEDLCSFTPKAKVQMTGQNGKVANSNLKLGTSCGKV